jgi:hypothetical protein
VGAVRDAFAHAAQSVSRKFRIPAEAVVESFDLDPLEAQTIREMVKEAEEEEIPY